MADSPRWYAWISGSEFYLHRDGKYILAHSNRKFVKCGTGDDDYKLDGRYREKAFFIPEELML